MSEPSVFLSELQVLINKYSKENKSGTPDYVLALFLGDCLEAYDRAVISREKHQNSKNKKATVMIGDKPV